MNDTFLEKLKQLLDDCISDLDACRDRFCSRPGIDFSRNRKITLPALCNFLLRLQGKSMPCELLDFWGQTLDAPSPSAMLQQREKLLPEALAYLFRSFCKKTRSLREPLYCGYRLLACDGSDIIIYRNSSDEETFIHEGRKGYNTIHANAMYDLIGHTYTDVIFQGKKKLHERAAFCQMVDRPQPDKVIYIADRGYESFNTFAHVIRSGQKFLIRMKDISSNGILSSYELPDSEFDDTISTVLTRRHTKETMDAPEVYTILAPSTDFDFLDAEHMFYPISFRIVRFRTEAGTYVCVATNLDPSEFPLEAIRDLYRMRWGEETSFRELKYTVGMVYLHSRRKDLILQELYARFIIYNFCELATQHAAATLEVPDGRKHTYRIDFTTAVNICRAFLKDGVKAAERLLLIQRHLTPIRDGRKYELDLRHKRSRDFIYRPA